MGQTIVFDFDETLSTFDTIYPFLLFCNKDSYLLLSIKKILWLITKVFLRLKVISNNKLKKIGIFLFIYKYPINDIIKSSESFFKKITYHQDVINELNKYLNDNTVYISSASFGEYLGFFVENYKSVSLLCSTIKYANNKVSGLEFNNFAENKTFFFQQNNIAIDVLYTDSYSDEALAKISKKIILVQPNGALLEINSYFEFVNYFKK